VIVVEPLIDPGRVASAGMVARWLWPILRPIRLPPPPATLGGKIHGKSGNHPVTNQEWFLVRFLAFQCVFANQGWRRRNRHKALKTKALLHENGGLSAIPKVLYILPAVEPYPLPAPDQGKEARRRRNRRGSAGETGRNARISV
jgi:hypothetical protein